MAGTSEFHLDIGSSAKVKSPSYLIAAHQRAARSVTANTAMKASVFDHVDVRKYFVEIDGSRYPRDSANIDYATNDKLDQNGDLKTFFEEYAKETLLKPFITYTAMKKSFLFKDIDIRFQIDNSVLKKLHY